MALEKGKASSKKATTPKSTGGKGKGAGGGIDKPVSSVWLEGPDKAKSIADNFGKSLDQIFGEIRSTKLTQIENVFKEGQGVLSGFLGGLVSKFEGLKAQLPIDQAKALLNEGKRYYEAGKEGLQIYKDFQEGNFDAALAGLSPVLGEHLTKYGQGLLDGYKAIHGTNFHDWKSVMNLASQLTGVDIGGILGIAKLEAEVQSVLQLAQKYNIPDAIKMLKEKFGKSPRAQQALATGMEINAKLGQLSTIDELLTVVDGSLVLRLKPNIIKEILANYRLPEDKSLENLEKEREKLLSVLTRIDPTWDHEMINNEKLFLLKPWVNASQDAIRLFNGHEDYDKPANIARRYSALHLKVALNQTYPYLKLI